MPDPAAQSAEVVWHNPTEYDMAVHGPPYLPSQSKQATKLGADQKREVRTFLNRQAAFYDTPHRMVQETPNMQPLSLLLAMLRGMAHIHQTHHWQTRGQSYYGDHLLFMRLYEESQDFIDQVAERAVGAGSASLVDPIIQINMTAKIVRALVRLQGYEHPAQFSPEQMVQVSLQGEVLLLGLVKKVIELLEASDSLSPGTSNLLEGLADKHETFVYLLRQRASFRVASYDRR